MVVWYGTRGIYVTRGMLHCMVERVCLFPVGIRQSRKRPVTKCGGMRYTYAYLVQRPGWKLLKFVCSWAVPPDGASRGSRESGTGGMAPSWTVVLIIGEPAKLKSATG